MTSQSKVPERNSTEWKRNERIITKHPALRQARDIQQGFAPSSGITTPVASEAYKSGYDAIDWSKK